MSETYPYEDIIDLPRPVSARRCRMTDYDRAAQFSPFAALTGYDGAIAEAARLTEGLIDLDEGGKELLDKGLRTLLEKIDTQPAASFTCYRPDDRKQGGAYITVTGRVRRIDPVSRCVFLTDGQALPMDRIFDIREL